MGFHGGTLLLFECVFRCPFQVSTCFNPSYHPMIQGEAQCISRLDKSPGNPPGDDTSRANGGLKKNTNSAHVLAFNHSIIEESEKLNHWQMAAVSRSWSIREFYPVFNCRTLFPHTNVATVCINVSPVSPNIFKLQTCLNIQVVSYPQTRKNLSEYQRSKPSQHSSVKRKRCCKVKRYKTFKADVTHGVVWTTTIVQKDIYKCIMILNMYTYMCIYILCMNVWIYNLIQGD